MFSKDCREIVSLEDFTKAVERATDAIGLEAIKTYKAEIDGGEAVVTYTFPTKAINQTDQSWIDEKGWHNDDC
ncbi:hypothetical protein BH09ACT10_BH09ACT10_26150 [soil metagenome]